MVDPVTEAKMREDLQHDDAIELGAVSEETHGGVDTAIEDREPLF